MQQHQLTRYARQLRLSGFGKDGQEKLLNSKILVVGCGALGCPALIYLAASGVGRVTICDPDKVEETNLHRQILFDKNDIGLDKADVASEKLQDQNQDCKITAVIQRLDEGNAASLVSSHDIVIDASDNYETRFLINKTCVEQGKPYVFGAVAGWQGQAAILQGQPCLECFYQRPENELDLTCENNGILGAIAGQIGSLQASLAVKYLIGSNVFGNLYVLNFKPEQFLSENPQNLLKTLKISQDKACKTCG